MEAPCTEIVLTLNNVKSGKETISARTDHQGVFEFSTVVGEKYTVSSGSKFYEVVSPDKPIHSGQSIQVVLKQK